MNHGTCRVEKIKSLSGIADRLGHNNRTKGLLLNVDTTRTHLNEVLEGSDQEDEVLALAQERLKLVSGKIKQGQKKQILANEVLLTVTSDSLEKNGGVMTPEKMEQYLQKGHEFILKRFGKDNVISAIMHRDEGPDHIQYIIMGVHEVTKKVRKVVAVDEKGKKTFADTPETKSKFVLNSQHFWGGSGKMSEFQTDFYENVSKEFGLERGERVTKKAHDKSDLGIALTRREQAVLEKERKALEKEKDLTVVKAELERKEQVAREKEKDLQEAEKELRQRISVYEAEKKAFPTMIFTQMNKSLQRTFTEHGIRNEDVPLFWKSVFETFKGFKAKVKDQSVEKGSNSIPPHSPPPKSR